LILDLSLGEKVLLLRKRRGELQSDLAESLNVSIGVVARLERDESLPDSDLIIAICKHYDISADWLLGIERRSE